MSPILLWRRERALHSQKLRCAGNGGEDMHSGSNAMVSVVGGGEVMHMGRNAMVSLINKYGPFGSSH